MEQTVYNNMPGLGWIFRFVDRHRMLTNIILTLEAITLLWAILNYQFTTNF